MNNLTRLTSNLKRLCLSWALLLMVGCSDAQYEALFDQAISGQRWLAGWQSNVVQIDETQVHYLDNQLTDAKHTLLFVHGYTGNKDMWNRLSHHLPDSFRLIAIDLLGHGQTDQASDNRYLLMNQAKLVKAFIDQLNLGPVHIIGSSMGGATSLLFSLHFPDYVASLSLMNSAGVHGLTESEFEVLIKSGKNPLAVKNIEGFDAMMGFIFYEAPWLPDGFKQVIVNRAIPKYQHYQYVLSELMHSSRIWRESGRIYGLMPHFKKPVLVVWGDHDRVLHPTSIEVFKEHLTHAETHMLKNTGHVPMIEKPELTAEILTAFITKS